MNKYNKRFLHRQRPNGRRTLAETHLAEHTFLFHCISLPCPVLMLCVIITIMKIHISRIYRQIILHHLLVAHRIFFQPENNELLSGRCKLYSFMQGMETTNKDLRVVSKTSGCNNEQKVLMRLALKHGYVHTVLQTQGSRVENIFWVKNFLSMKHIFGGKKYLYLKGKKYL